MTVLVLGTLLILALVDGACSGFRSGLGRTGLIRHGSDDRESTRRGLSLVGLLLAPAAILFAVDVLNDPDHLSDYVRAGQWVLFVLLPYAVGVVLALGAYWLLDWRKKYLATAVILGPFTLLRPAVAAGAALAGVCTASLRTTEAALVLATLAVLAVEPLANRRRGSSG